MGGIQDFDQFDSPGLAELVRQGQVTALELCEESIERINRHNPLLKVSGIVDKMVERSLSRTPFTQIANLCGLPAMSVPLHWTPGGLPCGTHLIAPFGDEATHFRLASQQEKACPWFDRRPQITRKSSPEF